MIAKTLVIYVSGVGGVGTEVREKMEKLTIVEKGDIQGFVGSISVDSDQATAPDILLNRQLGEYIISKHKCYEITHIPQEITVEHLRRAGKGALLNRKLGRLHTIVNSNTILDAFQAKVRAIVEGEGKTKERGLEITDGFQAILAGSVFTGMVSAMIHVAQVTKKSMLNMHVGHEATGVVGGRTRRCICI